MVKFSQLAQKLVKTANELDANNLESTYYNTTQNSDGNDGGNNANAYEVGTNLTINALGSS